MACERAYHRRIGSTHKRPRAYQGDVRFWPLLRHAEVHGVLLRMGNSNRNFDLKAGRASEPSDYDNFSSEDDVEAVASYPTDLNAVRLEAFDRIARHGYEIAERTLTTYHPNHFGT
jgi:hypothetical protein